MRGLPPLPAQTWSFGRRERTVFITGSLPLKPPRSPGSPIVKRPQKKTNQKILANLIIRKAAQVSDLISKTIQTCSSNVGSIIFGVDGCFYKIKLAPYIYAENW